MAPGPGNLSQQNLNSIVIEYLSKKGYSRTEAMLRMESASTDSSGRPLHRRAEDAGGDKYFRAYKLLQEWIDQSLDLYKLETSRLLWPIFVYSFLNLAAEFYVNDCERFFTTYRDLFESEHEDELRRLSAIRLPEHLQDNVVAQNFRKSRYRVTLSSVAYFNLIHFLESKEKEGGAVVIHLLQTCCNLVTVVRNTADPHSLVAMFQKARLERDMPAEDEGLPGHNPGSANTNENAPDALPKLKLGLLPMEAELMTDVRSELEDEDAAKPARPGQNSLVEEFEKYIKQEANDDAPARADLPLPPSMARDVVMEVLKVKENRDRFVIEGRSGGVGPGVSVVMFTFHNTNDSINCLALSDNNQLVAAGTSQSYIRVWSLDGSALPSVMPPVAGEPATTSSRRLIGHSGPVYAVSFSPSIANYHAAKDDPSTAPRYLLSCSADKSVRMWSVEAWACLVVYKGHDNPVWDVAWGPHGHYFVTGGRDRTARLWSTDHISYLRMFVGHDDDVDVVAFHPNASYVFSGSCDKTVRMWSIPTGNAVRLFTGHTGNLTALACSPDGKTLASADDAGSILLWDLASGRRLKRMRGHGRGGIWSVSWSVESTVLVSAGGDGTVRVWDAAVPNEAPTAPPLPQAQPPPPGQPPQPPGDVSGSGATTTAAAHVHHPTAKIDAALGPGPGLTGAAAAGAPGGKKKNKDVIVTPDQISAFPTKRTAVYKAQFTRMNLVVAGGAYLC
ncbi:MAG: Transcription initiation factor TFIID subunit 5 [Phylliscum demangeonii]|nr:MAG: Transcription initiation factor TFIID subunit 5 [Phylliscum demangeonii]